MIFITKNMLNDTIYDAILKREVEIIDIEKKYKRMDFDKQKQTFTAEQSSRIDHKIEIALLEYKEKERQERKLKEWHKFFDAEKVGYLISHKGLEWECIKDGNNDLKEVRGVKVCFGRQFISLLLGGKVKSILIDRDKPQDMSFVMEGDT